MIKIMIIVIIIMTVIIRTILATVCLRHCDDDDNDYGRTHAQQQRLAEPMAHPRGWKMLQLVQPTAHPWGRQMENSSGWYRLLNA
jgi:hypothetical protein